MLLRAVVHHYLHARGDLALGTLRSHRYILEWFCCWAGPLCLGSLKPQHLTKFLADHPQWAPSTARLRLSVIKVFTAWCATNGYLERDPGVHVRGPRQPRGIPRELDAEDFWKILNACQDRRSEAMVSLLFREGLRRSGLVALNVEDVDRDVLLVTEKGGHQRVMPISTESAVHLSAYLAEWPAASGPAFRSYLNGARLHPNSVTKIITGIFWDSGVKQRPWDGKSGHAGRHTFAGQMIDSGADIRIVSDALGHQNVATTSIYLRKRRTVAQIRPFLPSY